MSIMWVSLATFEAMTPEQRAAYPNIGIDMQLVSIGVRGGKPRDLVKEPLCQATMARIERGVMAHLVDADQRDLEEEAEAQGVTTRELLR